MSGPPPRCAVNGGSAPLSSVIGAGCPSYRKQTLREIPVKCPVLSTEAIVSDDAELAAALSSALACRDTYLPVLDGPRLTAPITAQRSSVASRRSPLQVRNRRFSPDCRLRLAMRSSTSCRRTTRKWSVSAMWRPSRSIPTLRSVQARLGTGSHRPRPADGALLRPARRMRGQGQRSAPLCGVRCLSAATAVDPGGCAASHHFQTVERPTLLEEACGRG